MISYQNGLICLKFSTEDFIYYVINLMEGELGMEEEFRNLNDYSDEIIEELNELDKEWCFDTPLDCIDHYCNGFNIHDFLEKHREVQ